jgi:hypothetical protein
MLHKADLVFSWPRLRTPAGYATKKNTRIELRLPSEFSVALAIGVVLR